MSTLIRNEQKEAHHSAAMKIVDNSTATVISAANSWHPVQGLYTNHHLDGVLFEAGSSVSISSVANPGGGAIRVQTSAAHGFAFGDPVAIVGSSAYDDIYIITAISDTTHFDVTATYSATDTGFAILPDRFQITKTTEYTINLTLSGTAETNNDILTFSVFINNAENTGNTVERKFSSSDVGAVASSDIFDLSEDDWLYVVIRNNTGAGDFTILYSNLNIMSAP